MTKLGLLLPDEKIICCKVNLMNIRKGVFEMIDYDARMQKRVEETKLDMARKFVDSMKNEHTDEDYTKIIKKGRANICY